MKRQKLNEFEIKSAFFLNANDIKETSFYTYYDLHKFRGIHVHPQ